MKKLLMFVMCSIMAVSYARADDTEQLRAACQSSDKTVWVELNKVCIPKHPCKDSDSNYCDRIFKDIQVASSDDAKKLVDLYLSKRFGLICRDVDMDKAHNLGQDYIRCGLSNASYKEFEFDDYSESNSSTANFGYAKALCLIYKGRPETVFTVSETSELAAKFSMLTTPGMVIFLSDPISDGRFLSCSGVSKETCEEIYSGNAVYLEKEETCYPTESVRYN